MEYVAMFIFGQSLCHRHELSPLETEPLIRLALRHRLYDNPFA